MTSHSAYRGKNRRSRKKSLPSRLEKARRQGDKDVRFILQWKSRWDHNLKMHGNFDVRKKIEKKLREIQVTSTKRKCNYDIMKPDSIPNTI